MNEIGYCATPLRRWLSNSSSHFTVYIANLHLRFKARRYYKTRYMLWRFSVSQSVRHTRELFEMITTAYLVAQVVQRWHRIALRASPKKRRVSVQIFFRNFLVLCRPRREILAYCHLYTDYFWSEPAGSSTAGGYNFMHECQAGTSYRPAKNPEHVTPRRRLQTAS